MNFSIKDFFRKCDLIPEFSADLVTFTEEILNGKLYFLCSVSPDFADFMSSKKKKHIVNIVHICELTRIERVSRISDKLSLKKCCLTSTATIV